MNFSIIGTGFIMPRHVEAINFVGGKIIDIVNDAHGKDEWKQIVKNPQADCIVILTPNDLHFEMTKLALEYEKIVLCEKPLTIKSAQALELIDRKDVFTVLQLHYHPLVNKLKQEAGKSDNFEIEMNISVHRDPEYYQIWKGQKERSGGVLFNLGIHYFELLLHLFGQPEKISTTYLDDKTGEGLIEGKNYRCNWRISTAEAKETQKRVFKINGVDYNFSSKDNLSYENLHRPLYQDLLKGEGITPHKALPSIKLVEDLYAAYLG